MVQPVRAINNAKAKILRIQPFVVEFICPRRFKGMAGVIKLDPTSYPKLDRNDNLIPYLLKRYLLEWFPTRILTLCLAAFPVRKILWSMVNFFS